MVFASAFHLSFVVHEANQNHHHIIRREAKRRGEETHFLFPSASPPRPYKLGSFSQE